MTNFIMQATGHTVVYAGVVKDGNGFIPWREDVPVVGWAIRDGDPIPLVSDDTGLPAPYDVKPYFVIVIGPTPSEKDRSAVDAAVKSAQEEQTTRLKSAIKTKAR